MCIQINPGQTQHMDTDETDSSPAPKRRIIDMGQKVTEPRLFKTCCNSQEKLKYSLSCPGSAGGGGRGGAGGAEQVGEGEEDQDGLGGEGQAAGGTVVPGSGRLDVLS